MAATSWRFFIPNGEQAKPYTAYQQWNFLCIPTTSKHSDVTMDVVNWLSIKENHDLMEYGIQGKDWEPVGDSSYKALSGYTFPGYVLTWRPTLNRTPDTMMQDDKKWFDFSTKTSNFTLSPIAGFNFNAEKVKTEYAKNHAAARFDLPAAKPRPDPCGGRKENDGG
ncbi:hypothetical protein ACFSQ7_51085 [Paenibacillus rhizoplanae]